MTWMTSRGGIGPTLVELAADEWPDGVEFLRKQLARSVLVSRGRVHAQDVSNDPQFDTYELADVMVTYSAPAMPKTAQAAMSPNLPWAEDHFQERVCGEPLNPAPSEAWWPFKQNGNAAHKTGEVFSHTYPERVWPKYANLENTMLFKNGREANMNVGIRYPYGDLDDVVRLLGTDPFTRQAYLPIWFPEDTGAVFGQRVPCSLGYHFIRRGVVIDCIYTMRSCDFFRHYTDDAYMAIRLLQDVVSRVVSEYPSEPHGGHFAVPYVGRLIMNIANLHAFRGDNARLGVE